MSVCCALLFVIISCFCTNFCISVYCALYLPHSRIVSTTSRRSCCLRHRALTSMHTRTQTNVEDPLKKEIETQSQIVWNRQRWLALWMGIRIFQLQTIHLDYNWLLCRLHGFLLHGLFIYCWFFFFLSGRDVRTSQLLCSG